MEMKKRVSQKLGNKNPAEVVELLVDNCLSGDGEVEGLTDEYTGLEVLSMVNVGLKSLSKLPPLPKLRKLEVSDNVIAGGLDALSEKCPNLTYLNLSGNKIKELDVLKVLQNLKNLKSLDLYSCEVSTLEDYRDSVFELLPQLTYLDGFDQEDNEVPDSEPDGDGEATPPPQCLARRGPAEQTANVFTEDEDEAGPVGSEGEEDEVGLSYLMKEGIQDEDDDGDYMWRRRPQLFRVRREKRDVEDEGDDDDD
uniref:Acidic leucine-rich nuclear phosphoprotein 32 family member n=1 Tax=Tetraodon nigroviridis TaxID=99883 RepID=H3CB90_TETNG